MCRNIKPLFNLDPPATEDESRGAARQFVRKIRGYNAPSNVNEAAFLMAVNKIAAVSGRLLNNMKTSAPAKNRLKEAAKRRERAARRFR